MIRPFEQSDMEPVLDIWLEASIQSHAFVEEDFWRSKIPDMREVYLPSGETFVYEENGVVEGFVSLYENTLAAIFVAPQAQGRGIGKKLMGQAKQCRDEISLSVYKENLKSILFYEKCGFNRLTEQADAHTGHMEYVMRWRP